MRETVLEGPTALPGCRNRSSRKQTIRQALERLAVLLDLRGLRRVWTVDALCTGRFCQGAHEYLKGGTRSLRVRLQAKTVRVLWLDKVDEVAKHLDGIPYLMIHFAVSASQVCDVQATFVPHTANEELQNVIKSSVRAKRHLPLGGPARSFGKSISQQPHESRIR